MDEFDAPEVNGAECCRDEEDEDQFSHLYWNQYY